MTNTIDRLTLITNLGEIATLRVKQTKSSCACALLDVISEEFPFPFSRPIVWSQKEVTLSTKGYAVQLMRTTPSGRISTKNMETMFFHFCPFCGTKIDEGKLKE